MTLKDRVWSCSSSYHGIRSIADAALADKYGVQGSFLSPEDAIAGQTWEDDRFSRILASSHHKSPAPTDHRRSPTAGIQRVGRDGDDFASSRLKAASTTVMPDQIDVLLHGLGAIGSFYAFILSRSDRVRLTVVARSNYKAVCEKGITITSEIHGQHTFHPYRVVKSPTEASPVDYIVCAHKAIDQEAAAASLKPAVDPSRTTIVIIQNGVGNEEPFRKQFSDASIVTCVVSSPNGRALTGFVEGIASYAVLEGIAHTFQTWVGAIQVSPGIVKHTKSEDMQLGLFPNPEIDHAIEMQRLQAFANLLEQGQTRFQILEDIQRKRWEKVVWNAAWNSLTALTLVDTQTWLHSSSDADSFTRQLMREVIHIARGCGIQIADELVDQLMDRINALPGIGSSMQTDCKNGPPMEIDVIIGFPVRKSRELGIPAPYLEALYVILRAVDDRLRAAL